MPVAPEFGAEDAQYTAYFGKTTEGENEVESGAHKLDKDSTHGAELEASNAPGPNAAVKKSVGSHGTIGQQEIRVARRETRAASPHWEKKASYDSNVHNLVSLTIRRSRSRPVLSSNDTNGASVPRFGDWDEKNPSSADRFSQIFEMVREEKLTGGDKVLSLCTEASNSKTPKRDTPAIYQSCCCFPWTRK